MFNQEGQLEISFELADHGTQSIVIENWTSDSLGTSDASSVLTEMLNSQQIILNSGG